jgi:hypothetical protein
VLAPGRVVMAPRRIAQRDCRTGGAKPRWRYHLLSMAISRGTSKHLLPECGMPAEILQRVTL